MGPNNRPLVADSNAQPPKVAEISGLASTRDHLPAPPSGANYSSISRADTERVFARKPLNVMERVSHIDRDRKTAGPSQGAR